jgi:hypothetical protein
VVNEVELVMALTVNRTNRKLSQNARNYVVLHLPRANIS